MGNTVGAAPNPWVLCRAFAGGLTVSRARLGPAVTESAVGAL